MKKKLFCTTQICFVRQLPLTCQLLFGVDQSIILEQSGLSIDILHADYRLIPLSQLVVLLERLYIESEVFR